MFLMSFLYASVYGDNGSFSSQSAIDELSSGREGGSPTQEMLEMQPVSERDVDGILARDVRNETQRVTVKEFVKKMIDQFLTERVVTVQQYEQLVWRSVNLLKGHQITQPGLEQSLTLKQYEEILTTLLNDERLNKSSLTVDNFINLLDAMWFLYGESFARVIEEMQPSIIPDMTIDNLTDLLKDTCRRVEGEIEKAVEAR